MNDPIDPTEAEILERQKQAKTRFSQLERAKNEGTGGDRMEAVRAVGSPLTRRSATRTTKPRQVIPEGMDASPWKCPDCGQICEYAPHTREDAPRVRMMRRPPCECEEREGKERDRRRATEEAERQRRAAVAAQQKRQGLIRANWERSGITLAMRTAMTFETFDTTRHKTTAYAFALLKEWAENFKRGETHRGFCLESPGKGCGKTHLVVATGAVLLERGFSVYMTSMAEMLETVRDEWRKPWEQRTNPLTFAKEVDVLILDDFGVERIKPGEDGDWVRENLFRLFDARDKSQLPVLCTTNLYPAQMARRIGGDEMGARVVSRLGGLTDWLTVDGPDGRSPSLRQSLLRAETDRENQNTVRPSYPKGGPGAEQG